MNLLYKFLNWYTQRFPFPFRGWKYVQPLLQRAGFAEKHFIKKLFNGLSFYVNTKDHIQKTIFWYGYYEKDVSLVWQRLVQEDSYVIDIGANIGYFSLLAGAKAKNGKIFSFEPVHRFRTHMQKNIALNGITNIEILPFCISNKNEPVQIYIAAEDNTGMSSLQPPENFSGHKEAAQAIRLDDWLNETGLPRVDIVKLDVEGAEKKALDGMLRLLEKKQPVIFVEIINTQLAMFSHSAQMVYITLSHYNYQAFEIINPYTLKKINDHKEGYDVLFLPANYKLPPGLHVQD